MKTFEHFPQEVKCPICGTNEDSECWLLPVDGTSDGSNEEVMPVHVSCTGRQWVGGLRCNQNYRIIYAVLDVDGIRGRIEVNTIHAGADLSTMVEDQE